MNIQTVSTASNGRWTQKQILSFANRLFWCCFLAYVCSYIGRKNFSACLPEMIGEGLLTKTFGGYITTAYMLVYGAGQLINGFLGSRYKPKYMIGVGLFGATICNLIMGLLQSAWPMPFVWAANGLFHSMLWAPIIRIFTDQIPDERRLWAGANIGASCCTGAVLAFFIPGIILEYSDWRCVFYVSAAILFVSFVVWVVGNKYLRGYTKLMDAVCASERAKLLAEASMIDNSECTQKAPNRKYSLIALMFASGIWLMLIGLICNGALRDGIESWVPTFLKEQFNISASRASFASVMVPLISLSGTYTANWLNYKYIKNELYTAGLMFAVATLAVVGVFFTREVNVFVCAFFLSLSTAAMWGSNHMFLTQLPYQFSTYGMSAALTGFLNSVIYFASAAGSCLYGILADLNNDWNIVIYVWLASGVVGTIFCYISGRSWAKKRDLTQEGKLLS